MFVGLLAAGPVHALQCVPYAREVSGIDIKGDAWKWWNAAAGAYDRGHRPRLGAVIVFRKHGRMRLGHVAVVAQLINSRTMLIDHANWGPRGAGHGGVSNKVAVRDVSRGNDWSEVQVWNTQTQDFGTQTYPTYGFIYSRKERPPERAAYAAELPEEVAALLASSPAESIVAHRTDFELKAASSQAQSMPEAKIERIEALVGGPQPISVPAAETLIWEGDREAAHRAGSGQY